MFTKAGSIITRVEGGAERFPPEKASETGRWRLKRRMKRERERKGEKGKSKTKVDEILMESK